MGAGDSALLHELQTAEPCPPLEDVANSINAGRTGSSRGANKLRSRLEKLRLAGGNSGQTSSSSGRTGSAPVSSESSPRTGRSFSIGKKFSISLGRKRGNSSAQPGSLNLTPTTSQMSLNAMANSTEGPLQYDLAGADGRTNRALVAPCRFRAADRNVVFFPGDVQDTAEVMVKDVRLSNWVSYSYEAVLERLEARYPTANIILIVPSRKHLGAYSCYDNFLETDTFGAPTSNWSDLKANLHLFALIDSLQTQSSRAPTAKGRHTPLGRVGSEPMSSSASSSPVQENVMLPEVCSSVPAGNSLASSSPLSSPRSSARGSASNSASNPKSGILARAASSSLGEGDKKFRNVPSSMSLSSAGSRYVAVESIDGSLPVTLVGFSKGCVVLNRLVAEMNQDSRSGPGGHLSLRQLCREDNVRELSGLQESTTSTTGGVLESVTEADPIAASPSPPATGEASGAPRCRDAADDSVTESSSNASLGGGGSLRQSVDLNRGVVNSQALTTILQRNLSRRGTKADDSADSSKKDSAWPRFPWDRVESIVWLDGGHSGKVGAWITEKTEVRTLVTTVSNVQIHTTPYQVNNTHAPWKRDEYHQFRHLLHSAGRAKASVNVFDHSTQEEPSIKVHFRVLDVF
ncbi:uncharacterized protein LOC135827283 [Sycon ciliatum]|uniref:uncharacterized protein LOC135827283 n=1 Tax=Sycon ciliatum TaxID=27933 RepID=UPI0031F62539